MEDSLSSRKGILKYLIVIYFAISLTEVLAEFFAYKPLIVGLKPLMPLTLMIVYFFSSSVRSSLFFLAMLFSAITNVLFIPDTPESLYLALIIFTFHRVFVLALMIRLLKMRDWVPPLIGAVPFLLIFFYMLFNSEFPQDTFWILCIQNVLISVLAGLALSNYIMVDNRQNSWLLICGLLFVALQVIVFIEKYYLAYLSPVILRPIAMGLNAFAFYTFYEFVISTEKSDNDGAAA